MIERRDEHGFTLLELMIALFVLSVAIAGLVGVLDTAFGTTAVDVHRIDATGLATQELASLRAKPYAEILAPYTPAAPILTTINNQQFATSYTTSWVSSSNNDADAYKQVSVTVAWRDQVGTHTIEQDSDVYPGGLGLYDTLTSQGPSPSPTTTVPLCPSPVVSATPLVSAQSSGDPSLDVSWPEPDPASSVVPIVSWAVQVSPDGSTWTTAVNDEAPLAVGQNHQIEFGGLTPGISYHVRLLAFGACGAPGLSPAATAAGPITATLSAPDCTVGAVSLSSPVATRQLDGSLTDDITVVASTATGCTAGLWAGVVTSGTAVTAVPLAAQPGGWFTASLDATGPWDLGPHTVEVFSGLLIAGPLPTSTPLAAAELCVTGQGGGFMLKREGEGGYTLLELAVTMSIMLVVIGGLLGALESGTSAEHNASTRIDDEQAVAVVLAQFTRDVRNASAIETIPTPSLSTTVELVEPSGSGSQYVRWAIEPAGSDFALTRYLATSPGDPGSPGVTVGGLTGASAFDRQSVNGTELVDPPPAFLLTETDAARCAGTIEASIVSNAHPPSAPFTENVAAQVHATTSVVAASFEPVGQLDVRGCP